MRSIYGLVFPNQEHDSARLYYTSKNNWQNHDEN